MGMVYAEIQLINAAEQEMAKRHVIGQDEVTSIRINMLVDSGAYMMAINETISQQLNLTSKGKRKAQMADGSVVEYDVVGPIEVRFKNKMVKKPNYIFAFLSQSTLEFEHTVSL